MKLLLSIILLFVNLAFLSAQEESLSPNTKAVIESITVSPGGEVTISWTITPSSDLQGFDINRMIVPTGFFEVAYVPYDPLDPDLTFTYTPTDYNPCTERAIYAVRADITGVSAPLSEDFSIIHFEVGDYAVCDLKSTLTWSALDFTYLGAPYNQDDPNSEYTIYYSIDGGITYDVLEILDRTEVELERKESYDGGQREINYYRYEHTGLTPGTTYSYYIRALNSVEGWTSQSCPKDLIATYYDRPDFYELLNATVVDDHIELTINVDISQQINSLRFYRSDAGPNNLVRLANIMVPSTPLTIKHDSSALVNQFAYYYQFAVDDQCDAELRSTEMHRTMLLAGEINFSGHPSLSWNEYIGWDVDHYKVLRQLDDESDFTEIDIIPSSSNEYIDLSIQQEDYGTVTYYIQAEADNQLINGAPAMSNSNRFYFSNENDPTFDIVNAFNPNSSNPDNQLFRPLGNQVDVGKPYLLQVFNRWGEVVFETRNRTEGWNGKFRNSGNLLPKGVYVYVLNYLSIEGIDTTERGTVVLIY